MTQRALFEKENTYSLRGLCMLMIIVHHLYQWTASRYGVHYPLPASIILQIMGNWGSSAFFLLSGYGLSLSLWKKKITAKDSLRRLSKLYLPFAFFWLVGFVILIFKCEPLSCKHLLGLATFDLPIVGGVNGL